MPGRNVSDGAQPLGDLFDQAMQSMRRTRSKRSSETSAPSRTGDGFIFSGNRHETVPRTLLLDGRLTPLERNAWQVFRLLLNEGGITTFPTYDQLAPYLSSMPCAPRASHETVARALTILRLTRWISLVRRHRDPRSGKIVGNLYVLHDEPLSPFEAMQLDPNYLGLVSRALDHASRSIQRVGVHTLKEKSEDPALAGRVLPSRIQVVTRRLLAQGWSDEPDYQQPVDSHDSEEGPESRLRNRDHPSSESEVSDEPRNSGLLRNPKRDSTVRKEKESIEERTILRARGSLRIPERFRALKPHQQSGAMAALQAVDAALHQPIMDEWEARCATSTVRNPAGYLFGLIQRAVRGEFNAWAGARSKTGDPNSPSGTLQKDEDAAAHIARLQSLMRLP